MDPLIINAAITGCVLTKADSPHIPITAGEIVDCARRVQDEGASIVHLHARKPDQTPDTSAGAYVELAERVRAACGDLIVCVSLSGRYVDDPEQRAQALACRPEMASLTVGSMNFAREPSVNAPDTIRELAGRIYAAGAVPEIEVFEAGFAHYAGYLISREILSPPHYFNLILGSLGAAPLDLVGLGHMVSLLPPGSTWAVGGIGRYQLDANVTAIAAGGHVRVGLEDNPFYDRERRDLADNARLVRRIVRIAREMGREPATPAQARALIGLPSNQTAA